jgi:uncharacterized membrane-anchored protein YhcB (DUF1043 family)
MFWTIFLQSLGLIVGMMIAGYLLQRLISRR